MKYYTCALTTPDGKRYEGHGKTKAKAKAAAEAVMERKGKRGDPAEETYETITGGPKPRKSEVSP